MNDQPPQQAPMNKKPKEKVLDRAYFIKAGKRGGLATRRKYGKAHYRVLALKRNALKPQKKAGKVIPSLDLTPPTPSRKLGRSKVERNQLTQPNESNNNIRKALR